MELADDDGAVLWSETAPLRWDEGSTTQTLEQGEQEQFFGGGMQNGRFSHRDNQITISRDFNWEDGGNPNAAPFYLSSNGYGVLRNTFAPVATTSARRCAPPTPRSDSTRGTSWATRVR